MADHWRTPRTRGQHRLAIASGALVGPLVAILFVVVVIKLAGMGG